MDEDNLDVIVNGENKALTKKHIAERQRRARINSYLEEIQQLTSGGTGTTASAKLEKAEVLERAVSYLQNTHGCVDPNNNSSHGSNDIDIYKKGFTSCMNRLFDHVTQSQELQPEAPGMKRHLGNFLQNHVTQFDTECKMNQFSNCNETGYYDTNARYSGAHTEQTVIPRAGNQFHLHNGFDHNRRTIGNGIQKRETLGDEGMRTNAHVANCVTDPHNRNMDQLLMIKEYTTKCESNNAFESSAGRSEGIPYRYSNLPVSVCLSTNSVNSKDGHVQMGQVNTEHKMNDRISQRSDMAFNSDHIFSDATVDEELVVEHAGAPSTRKQGVWRPW